VGVWSLSEDIKRGSQNGIFGSNTDAHLHGELAYQFKQLIMLIFIHGKLKN
jgi:hypothetical protein